MRPSPTAEHTAETILRRRLADLEHERDIALRRASEAQLELGIALDELHRVDKARLHVRAKLRDARTAGGRA